MTKRLLLIVGVCVWSQLCAPVLQKPNCPTEPWPYQTNFNTNPFANGRCWTKRTSSIYWVGPDAVSDPLIYTGNASTDLQIATREAKNSSTNADQYCVIQRGASSSSSSDYTGCIFRIDTSDYANSQHITVQARGGAGGDMYVAENTGNVADYAWVDWCDVGAPGGSDYLGFAISGSGTSREISAWDFGATPPSDLTDPTTWGTCACGLYDDTSGPGCSTDVDADADAGTFHSGYEDGYDVGLWIRDTKGSNDGEITWAYFGDW